MHQGDGDAEKSCLSLLQPLSLMLICDWGYNSSYRSRSFIYYISEIQSLNALVLSLQLIVLLSKDTFYFPLICYLQTKLFFLALWNLSCEASCSASQFGVTVVASPKPCGGLDIIAHLQVTMMEALKLFVLLSSQKAQLHPNELGDLPHTERRNRTRSVSQPIKVRSRSV